MRRDLCKSTQPPMVGLMHLMQDPVHREFINKYLLNKSDSEACIMFMSFYAILMERFPDKNGNELLSMLTNAHSNTLLRREMVMLWKRNSHFAINDNNLFLR